MNEVQLALTSEEKDYLVRLLQSALKETRVEVHRTHTPGFRESVLGEESLVRKLLAKVQGGPAGPSTAAPGAT
jgi:hypothetical protein